MSCVKSKQYKMKLISTIILILGFSIICYSQENKDERLTYADVTKLDSSILATDLYVRARAWFAEKYVSANDVIQMEDKENGLIIGKGKIKYTSDIFYGSEGTKGSIQYTIKVSVRQGRYRYEVTDFIHEGNPFNSAGQFSFGLITNSETCPYDFKFGSQKWSDKVWADIKKTIESNTPRHIESLKKDMSKPSKATADDW